MDNARTPRHSKNSRSDARERAEQILEAIGERAFQRKWELSTTKKVVRAAEEMLEEQASRTERQIDTYLRTGIDIGTREEANSQTGPYADQANRDRLALYLQEHRIGTKSYQKQEEE